LLFLLVSAGCACVPVRCSCLERLFFLVSVSVLSFTGFVISSLMNLMNVRAPASFKKKSVSNPGADHIPLPYGCYQTIHKIG
jgi:hypothetical protein